MEGREEHSTHIELICGPFLLHRLRVPQSPTSGHESNIGRLPNIATEEIHARLVHHEIGQRSGAKHPDGLVNAKSNRGIQGCGAQDLRKVIENR